MTASNKKSKFLKLAKACNSDNQKIDFFDRYQDAFFSDSYLPNFSVRDNLPEEFDDAFYVYANMKRMSETELEKLKELPWKKYPKNFKIFLFDFCILNSY